MFSERGRVNLQTLATPEARQMTVRPEQPSILVPYSVADGDADGALWHVANGRVPHVLVRRLDRRVESVWGAYADRPMRRVDLAAGRPPLRKAS